MPSKLVFAACSFLLCQESCQIMRLCIPWIMLRILPDYANVYSMDGMFARGRGSKAVS